MTSPDLQVGPRSSRGRALRQIKPDDHGLLEVGDANLVYWQAGGNPMETGRRSACRSGVGVYAAMATVPRPGQAPDHRVRPGWPGSKHTRRERPGVDLGKNTTHHLLADIEALRRQLRIHRWLVLGGSEGSTLGLAPAPWPARPRTPGPIGLKGPDVVGSGDFWVLSAPFSGGQGRVRHAAPGSRLPAAGPGSWLRPPRSLGECGRGTAAAP